MRRAVPASVLFLGLLGVALGATASAQDRTAPGGDYGGGAIGPPRLGLGTAGNMLISLRATGGQLQINASMGASCGTAALKGAPAAIAADGTFATRATGRERGNSGRRTTTTIYTLTGTIAGANVTGTASARTVVRRRGRRPTRCVTGTVMWSARRSTGDIGMPGATPNARMYGTTSQLHGGLPRALVLSVSPDRSKLTRARYDLTLRCERNRTITDLYDSPEEDLPIAADGTFSDVDRFTRRDGRLTIRVDERFTGTIGAAGASGTIFTEDRIFDRRTGRKVGGCSSGDVTWTAAP